MEPTLICSVLDQFSAAGSFRSYGLSMPALSIKMSTASSRLVRQAATDSGTDPARILHRQADAAAPRRTEHHRRLPRHLAAATAIRIAHHQNRSERPRPRSTRHHVDHHVSVPFGNRARQQHRHPQRPPGRDPIAIPLRGTTRTRTRRPHQPSTGDPAQTMRPGGGVLPHRRRDRRPARRA